MRGTAWALGGLLAFSLPLASAPSWSRARPHRAVIACVDPRAVLALTDPALLARRTWRWRKAVERSGRCERIASDTRWEPIYAKGTLLLMRRSPPRPGTPPLYFRAQSASPKAPPRTELSEAIVLPLGPPPISGIRLVMSPASFVAVQPPPIEPPRPARAPPPVASPALAAPFTVSDPAIVRRGYAVGFAISVLLIILLLSTIVLLLRLLFRRPVRVAPTEPVPVTMLPRPVPGMPRSADGSKATHTVIDAVLRPSDRLDRPVLSSRPRLRLYRGDQLASRIRPPADPVLQCAGLLKEAGWSAIVRQVHAGNAGSSGADVVARRRGRTLALRCVPISLPVDEAAIEQACMTRERERADMAAIICASPATFGALKLASETGITLLHPDQVGSFARSAG